MHLRGRRDRQVKIHGERMELGEVESILGQHPGVQRVSVLARKDVVGSTSDLLGGGETFDGGDNGGVLSSDTLAVEIERERHHLQSSSVDPVLVAYVESDRGRAR